MKLRDFRYSLVLCLSMVIVAALTVVAVAQTAPTAATSGTQGAAQTAATQRPAATNTGKPGTAYTDSSGRSAPPPAEQPNDVETRLTALLEENKEALEQIATSDLMEQLRQAMQALNENPTNLSKQLAVIRCIRLYSAVLKSALAKAQQASPAEMRDEIVAGYTAAGATLQQASQKEDQLATNTSGLWAKKHQELAQAFAQMAAAYQLQADRWSKLALAESAVNTAEAMIYIDSLDATLAALEQTLKDTHRSEQLLQRIIHMTEEISEVHHAVLRLADEVWKGTLEGSDAVDQPSGGGTESGKTEAPGATEHPTPSS